MIVVLDTNVLFASFATHGLCESLVQACLSSHVIVLSEPILAEFERHLRGKLKLPASTVAQHCEFLRAECTWVEPSVIPKNACRDPQDLMVLGTAVAAGADAIVSGDKDLLSLKAYKKIPIQTPREFYESIK